VSLVLPEPLTDQEVDSIRKLATARSGGSASKEVKP